HASIELLPETHFGEMCSVVAFPLQLQVVFQNEHIHPASEVDLFGASDVVTSSSHQYFANNALLPFLGEWFAGFFLQTSGRFLINLFHRQNLLPKAGLLLPVNAWPAMWPEGVSHPLRKAIHF